MANQTFSGHFIIRSNVILFHMCDHTIQNFFILRNPECTVTILNNGMCTACIKTGHDPAFFISSDRKLSFITVVIRLVHSDQRLHRKLLKSTNPFQMSAKLFLLKSFLLFIGNSLQLAATTLTGRRANRLYTIWRWFQNLHQASVTVVLFCFHDFGCNCISNDCVLYKNSEAISFANAFTVCSAIHNF